MCRARTILFVLSVIYLCMLLLELVLGLRVIRRFIRDKTARFPVERAQYDQEDGVCCMFPTFLPGFQVI